MLIRPIPYRDPLAAFAPLAHEPGALLLDAPGCGRLAFIAASPFEVLTAEPGSPSPFPALRDRLTRYARPYDPALPPFAGGLAGFLGYELGEHLERLTPRPPGPLPDLWLGAYDVVAGFDREARRAWVASTGLPEGTARRAEARADELEARLGTTLAPLVSPKARWIRADRTEAAYQAAVAEVVAAIRQGELFQANLTQRFEAELAPETDAFEVYRALRQVAPAPFSAFLRHADFALASISPERFIRVEGGRVETCPIKGTRRRGKTPEEDRALALELSLSGKDAAENVMIVDLMRSDLSRVCTDESVVVTELLGLHTFAAVHHLISTVQGQLASGQDLTALLEATFPPGSVTGAPKVQALEHLTAREGRRRGPYCGCVAWLGFDGCMDTSVAIRTAVVTPGRAWYDAGGGVVADSVPADEAYEARVKARPFFEALGG